MKPDGGNGGLDDNLPEVADEQIYRVQKEQTLHRVTVLVDGVEDGRHVHEQLGEH